jgi:hypothetical protein
MRPSLHPSREQIGDDARPVSVKQLLVVGDLPLGSLPIREGLRHLTELGLHRCADHDALNEKAARDLRHRMDADDLDPRRGHAALGARETRLPQV